MLPPAAPEQHRCRGEAQGHHGATRSKAGADEAGERPAGEAVSPIARDAPLAAEIAHRAAATASRVGMDERQVAELASRAGKDERQAAEVASRAALDDHRAVVAAPGEPAEQAAEVASRSGNHARQAAGGANRAEQTGPVHRNDHDERKGRSDWSGLALRDDRDG